VRVVGWISGLSLLAAIGAHAAPQDVVLPRLSFASVDWAAAIATLPNVDMRPSEVLSARSRRAGISRAASPRLAQINGVMSQLFAGLPTSPVPVLVPFDVAGLMQDQAFGITGPADKYFSGFHIARFFYPGPAGYDAAFVVRVSDVPELADVKTSRPVEVQISGSALLYNLATPIMAEGQPVAALEEEFPGIRRTVLEHHLRYTFVRFGVPYVVSVLCFDASVSRYRMPTCRSADQVAQHFLRALRVVGGMPRTLRPAKPLPIERPERVSRAFGYFAPGHLASGSGGGRADFTAYSQIRFPLEDAPAFAISQVYGRRDSVQAAELDRTEPSSAIWRDNFCERRGFPVGQCPAGVGHQGQDIRSAPCKPPPGADRCTHRGNIVAVRDGVILRSPRQEAAYLVVNSANEHIRFRYLHMNPRKMDAEGLLNGRRVHEGEIIGEVSNFSMKEAGTSYHLHFDIQVPTRHGWVFVNPYMTLVTAYERLIGQRGVQLSDSTVIASADPDSGQNSTSNLCFLNRAACRFPPRALTTATRVDSDLPGPTPVVQSQAAKETEPQLIAAAQPQPVPEAEPKLREVPPDLKVAAAEISSKENEAPRAKEAAPKRKEAKRVKRHRGKESRSRRAKAKSRHRQRVAHRY
jgi:hypothetical protein